MDKLIISSFAVSILLALYEFIGILKARITGRTKSTARVFVRFFIFVLLVLLLWQYIQWHTYISSLPLLPPQDVKISNIPFLICSFITTVIMLFVVVELFRLHRARKLGLTKNIGRFITAIIIILCLIPIFNKTIKMWDSYTQKLEYQYEYFKKK
ncbi:MAG: hypothetical protein JW983_00900 [Elusimicrobia bacterium]|nr:hypothetical protein [Elusimicrobiota bacterium]